MDLSILRRTTRITDDSGESLVCVHRPASVGHVEAWRQHIEARPKVEVDLVGWLRDGSAVGAPIIRDVVLGWREVTVAGSVPSTEEVTAAVLSDWTLLRRCVSAVVASADLDAAMGKG